ncbi:hypothetical protein ColLi_05005 [Colletotrichum liriopes]|uniref:Uncharacterized protein n=1 Tax=Colletotrichum liriopes TaxID=708192 RepID=A0AA37LRY6_9PEZI|nr:hypothetical protein ColLi_05005 [Colletotrichum liriopes]
MPTFQNGTVAVGVSRNYLLEIHDTHQQHAWSVHGRMTGAQKKKKKPRAKMMAFDVSFPVAAAPSPQGP